MDVDEVWDTLYLQGKVQEGFVYYFLYTHPYFDFF